MKNFLALLLMLFALNGQAQTAVIATTDTTIGNADRIRIRCGASRQTNEPLYIIDGVRTDAKALKSLHPEDIHSIDVLKDAKATSLYGNRALSGVIIITTKKASDRRLLVLDNETGMPLEGATVQLKKETDSVTLVSNEKGEVQAEGFKVKVRYQAKFSCIGYEPQEVELRWQNINDRHTVRLIRKTSVLDSIVVVGYRPHIIRCYSTCCGVLRTVHYSDVERKASVTKPSIYPNPATANSLLTIRALDRLSRVELLNVNGQLIRSVMLNQEKHSFQLPLTAISTGIYFIRMYHTNGRPADTQKLIIQ